MSNTFLKYLLIALLGFAFVIVTVLMALFGDRAWLIRKKLRLGALIIVLNGVVGGTGCGTCYDPASPDDAGQPLDTDDAGQDDAGDTAVDHTNAALN